MPGCGGRSQFQISQWCRTIYQGNQGHNYRRCEHCNAGPAEPEGSNALPKNIFHRVQVALLCNFYSFEKYSKDPSGQFGPFCSLYIGLGLYESRQITQSNATFQGMPWIPRYFRSASGLSISSPPSSSNTFLAFSSSFFAIAYQSGKCYRNNYYLYTVFQKKLCKIVFVRTSSNFHQF